MSFTNLQATFAIPSVPSSRLFQLDGSPDFREFTQYIALERLAGRVTATQVEQLYKCVLALYLEYNFSDSLTHMFDELERTVENVEGYVTRAVLRQLL